MVEWILDTPIQKFFKTKKVQKVFYNVPVGHPEDSSTPPVMLRKEKELQEEVIESGFANVVKLTHVFNDVAHSRLVVRFHYGRFLEDGTFQGAQFDDGVVFSGPTYAEHGFHEAVPDETAIMTKISSLLKWDGSMTVKKG